MKSLPAWFNTFLLTAAVALAATLDWGCKAPGKSKDLAAVRIHLEINPDGSDRSRPVAIGRSAPFMVNVERTPFLTEQQLKEATLVETNSGFALKLEFDQKGTWLLEQYTSAGRGKRAAIFATWEEELRWLAAPRMEQRIGDGVLIFTPDASREETERLVIGLNKSAKAIQSGRF
jgi:hypothetical protein